MAKLKQQEPYSFRSDPAVPEFDDDGPIAFLDGDCALCTRSARLISRYDQRREFRICPIQTDLGRAVLTHFGLDPGNPDSWLYVVDGQAYTSMDAIVRAGRRMGGIGHVLLPLRILPRPVADWIYRRIARNRYSVLGKADMCAVPDPRLRERLIG